MEDVIILKHQQDLHAYISKIETLIFVDDDGDTKLKVRVFLGDDCFQETITINKPVNNVIFLQNRTINHQLEIIEQHIRDGLLKQLPKQTAIGTMMVNVAFEEDDADPADQFAVNI